MLGHVVATVFSEKFVPGIHTRQWDVHGLASGVYFYQLATGDVVQTRKLVLLR
jgi:hypothetical protein